MVQMVGQTCDSRPCRQFFTDVKPAGCHVQQGDSLCHYTGADQMCDVYLIWANVARAFKRFQLADLNVLWRHVCKSHQNVGSIEPCELRITQKHCAPRMCSQQHHRRPKLDDVPTVGGANPTYHLAKREKKKIHLLRWPKQPNLPAQLKAHRLSKSKEITIIMTASLCHYRTTYQRL